MRLSVLAFSKGICTAITPENNEKENVLDFWVTLIKLFVNGWALPLKVICTAVTPEKTKSENKAYGVILIKICVFGLSFSLRGICTAITPENDEKWNFFL